MDDRIIFPYKINNKLVACDTIKYSTNCNSPYVIWRGFSGKIQI